MSVAALAKELRAKASLIAAQVTEATLRDPFWEQRFGARGPEHTQKDAAYHVEYVAQSLDMEDAAPMRNYARWLQTLLTTRGMCTRHIDENFARVGDAIAAHVADAEPALVVLEAARMALRHRGIADELDGIARDVVAALATTTTLDAEKRAVLVSYLGDALALDRPQTFGDHVAYLVRADGCDGPTLTARMVDAVTPLASPALRAAVAAVVEA